MLEKIKLSMRIFHDAIDNDIQFNIDVCMLDLKRVGIHESVAVNTSEDPLIVKAAELYCKWQNNFQGKGEQYNKAYEKLRDAMSLCESYINENITGSEDPNV